MARTRIARPFPIGLILLAGLAGLPAAVAAEKVALVGVAVDDAAPGNGDGALEPGETVDLRIELHNMGTGAASGVSGALSLARPVPGVALLDAFATWPALFAGGEPQFSDPPHFRVRVAGFVACGAVLPFHLDVSTTAGSVSFDLPVKIGQQVDHDLADYPTRSFSRPDTLAFGENAGDGLGSAAASGDFNGDGYQDAVLGAQYADSISDARPDAGEASVVYGGSGRRNFLEPLWVQPGVATFFGAFAGDLLGSQVAAGDVNGDGRDDLLIAARGAPGPGRPNAGVVYLVYGQAVGFGVVDLKTPPAGVVRIVGADADDGRDGSDDGTVELASADLNADGFDEILIGFDTAASLSNGRPGAGEVVVISGRPAPLADIDLAAPPAGVARFWGADVGDSFGRAIGTGDLNHDSFVDLVIGAPSSDSIGNTRPSAGEAYVVHGRPAPWTDTDMAAPPAGVARLWGTGGTFDQQSLGQSVAIADLDGDGYGEVVLAVPGNDSLGNLRQNAGAVSVIFGQPQLLTDTDLQTPPAGTTRILGADAQDLLGGGSFGGPTEGLCSGDFNGDGHVDLAIGALFADSASNSRSHAGEAVLLYGPLRRGLDIDLASPPPGVTRFWGANAGDHFSSGLAAGDLDSDGLDDLIVGAPEADSVGDTRPDAGEAAIAYGKPTDTYMVRDIAFHPMPLLGEEVVTLPLQCDDCSTAVLLPFPFPFYGEWFNEIYVSSNGFLSFRPIDDALSVVPHCFPDRSGPNLIVAPLWTDLNPGAAPESAAVRVRVQGTAPQRRFIVVWRAVPHFPNIGATSFWAVLYEATGGIQFHYGDLDFGDPEHDGGKSAVVGLENGGGAHGLAFSCFETDLLPGGGSVPRALQFDPHTPLFESRFEGEESLWKPNPTLFQRAAACGRGTHTGQWSRYTGDPLQCLDGGIVAGDLEMPTIPDYPADTRLAFWSRRQVDPLFDESTVQISTTGAGFGTPISYVTDNSGAWRYEGVANLFESPGESVNLRFYHQSNSTARVPGWMVDDVQVLGCDAALPGNPENALAQIFATEPHTLCQGSVPGPTFDSRDSYCADFGEPVNYQWFDDGQPIPGATGPIHTVPAAPPAGDYSYALLVECDDGAQSPAGPIGYTFEAPLGAIGDSLRVSAADNGATLVFTWNALPDAAGYRVVQDGVPSGAFGTTTGATAPGTLQLTVPMPPGTLFFRVAGENACGPGALQ